MYIGGHSFIVIHQCVWIHSHLLHAHVHACMHMTKSSEIDVVINNGDDDDVRTNAYRM